MSESIRGNLEMLERLRAWAQPFFGSEIPQENLRKLQSIVEDAAIGSGLIPQYRREQ